MAADPSVRVVPSAPARSFHQAFPGCGIRVLATSAQAARDTGAFVADAVGRLSGASSGRAAPGLVVAFDAGEAPPETSGRGWAFDSLDWAGRLLGCDPPPARQVARYFRAVERGATRRGVPNAPAVLGILLRHRCGMGTPADVVAAYGLDAAAVGRSRWAAVIPTPRAMDAIVERTVAASFAGLHPAVAVALEEVRDELCQPLRDSLVREARGVLSACVLLEFDGDGRTLVPDGDYARALLERMFAADE